MNRGTIRRAFVVGLREDGSPTCHPMIAIIKAEDVVFNTYANSAKARNFRRNPDVAVVLLEDWSAAPSEARIAVGTLEEIDEAEPARATAGVTAGDLPDVPKSVSERARRRAESGKRTHFRLVAGD